MCALEVTYHLRIDDCSKMKTFIINRIIIGGLIITISAEEPAKRQAADFLELFITHLY
jgi:hypothetical protein